MKKVTVIPRVVILCLLLGLIAGLLLGCGTGAPPGRDPLANQPQAPAEPEREAESSSGLCGLALAPPLLLLLAAGFVIGKQPGRYP